MDQALERLKKLMGVAMEWGQLASFLPEGWALEPAKRRSAIASTFAASLEMAKLGQLEMRQEETFAPIYLRTPQRAETTP
jgi:segregation and condensation protein A